MLYEVIDSREVDQSAGLSSDETIKLTGPLTSQKYPDSLRLVVYEDFSTNTVYRFSMQLFRKSRQTLVFNKFKTCLKNSDTRKIQYCSI